MPTKGPLSTGNVKVDGVYFRQLRDQKGFTRKSLAELCHVSEKAIKQIETDPDHFSKHGTVSALANGLEVPFEDLTLACARPQLVSSTEEVVQWNMQIVSSAESVLAAAGSRSHDPSYLMKICDSLKNKPSLVHYRVLFGPPARRELFNHLLQLRSIRDPNDRTQGGQQTLHIANYEDSQRQAEFSICANEQSALVVLPSLIGIGKYDTAVVFQQRTVSERLVNFVRELYLAGRKIESLHDIKKLGILKGSSNAGQSRAQRARNQRVRRRSRTDTIASRDRLA